MVDLEILKSFGSTKSRIREVFTADGVEEPPARGETSVQRKERRERNRKRKTDFAFKQKLVDLMRTRIVGGIEYSLRNYRPYAAVDIAWDSTILSKVNLPILLYAQGKIDVQRAVASLEKLSNGKDYIVETNGKPSGINIPKFIEAEINMLRSMVLRRWSAQKNKYANLWPHYAYESRSTGMVGKFRADVLSQRVDIMVDQFGIREHDAQVMLDGLLYAHSVDFIRSAWEVCKQYRQSGSNLEVYVEREGLGWINPHPSRVFWDTSFPLSSLNSDSGCEYVGFWDVVRYGQIENNPDYFNRDAIGYGENLWGGAGLYRQYIDYFNQYNYVISAPAVAAEGENPSRTVDVAGANDAKTFVGVYNTAMRDSSMFKTEYFQKLVPKDWGLGDYPYEVWMRVVLASDSVPIYGEFLPSTPGAVLSINENNSRAVSVSFAMDLLQWQQHLTNLMNHLLSLLQIEGFKAIGINQDALEASEVEAIKKHLKANDWYSNPMVFSYSLSKKLEQLGAAANKAVSEVVTVSEARQGQSINTIFDAMTKLISIAEKMHQMSAAESGQSEPREISATQTNIIANTTQTIYSSISDAIDTFREAKKRIIYESLVNCSQAEVVCPVKNRYTQKTITAAGFAAIKSEDEDVEFSAKRVTVTGSVKNLVHSYIFSSRDGSERPVNTQAANTLAQLIGYTLAVPEVVKALGREKIYQMFNEFFRMSGAGLRSTNVLRSSAYLLTSPITAKVCSGRWWCRGK